ncbi:hypothetical protein LTR60_004923, partial [Cryomyces antarcticus]
RGGVIRRSAHPIAARPQIRPHPPDALRLPGPHLPRQHPGAAQVRTDLLRAARDLHIRAARRLQRLHGRARPLPCGRRARWRRAEPQNASADPRFHRRVDGANPLAALLGHRTRAADPRRRRRDVGHRRDPGRARRRQVVAADADVPHPPQHVPRLRGEPVARGRQPARHVAQQPGGRAGRRAAGEGSLHRAEGAGAARARQQDERRRHGGLQTGQAAAERRGGGV